jgi:hypothetical protein
MSELVARLAVQQLRNIMFPALPPTVQQLFPLIADPIVDGATQVPNIVVGQYQDYSANAPLPIICVYCEGAAEGLVDVYRHLTLHIEPWASAATPGPNADERRFISILYEYIYRCIQDVNWSGQKVRIQRCYEIERSPILFEPTNKVYHVSNSYRVEALSAAGWY